MANEEHVAILRQGVQVWNRWRRENPEVKPDLMGATLSSKGFISADFNSVLLAGTYIFGTSFSKSDFSGANLMRSEFVSVDFSGADLSSAQLSLSQIKDSDFSNANLRGADLTDVNMRSSRLRGTNLQGADLRGARFDRVDAGDADFSEAIVGYSAFGDVDLSEAKGLDLVDHFGPSSIGIDTIYRSRGIIPEVFLRDAGVPEQFITYARSLTDKAVEFYSCFISYSTKDEEFARKLRSRMRDEHLRVWFAPEDVKGGEKLHEQIERAIQLHDRLLIVLSEHSMQSEWVMTELRKARKAERKENRRKLFPISLTRYEAIKEWECFDADSGKDLAVEVREYFIPDFSNWKDHDSFEASFKRLLNDLRSVEL